MTKFAAASWSHCGAASGRVGSVRDLRRDFRRFVGGSEEAVLGGTVEVWERFLI